MAQFAPRQVMFCCECNSALEYQFRSRPASIALTTPEAHYVPSDGRSLVLFHINNKCSQACKVFEVPSVELAEFGAAKQELPELLKSSERAIIHHLARRSAPVERLNGFCLLCDQSISDVSSVREHSAHCPWRAAVEYKSS